MNKNNDVKRQQNSMRALRSGKRTVIVKERRDNSDDSQIEKNNNDKEREQHQRASEEKVTRKKKVTHCEEMVVEEKKIEGNKKETKKKEPAKVENIQQQYDYDNYMIYFEERIKLFLNTELHEGMVYVVPDFLEAQKMYVRRQYPVIYNLINEVFDENANSDVFSSVVLTGTPGIGKSTFIWYLVNNVLRERKFKRVVLCSIKNKKERNIVITKEINGEISVDRRVFDEVEDDYSKDPSTIFIVDKIHGARYSGAHHKTLNEKFIFIFGIDFNL